MASESVVEVPLPEVEVTPVALDFSGDPNCEVVGPPQAATLRAHSTRITATTPWHARPKAPGAEHGITLQSPLLERRKRMQEQCRDRRNHDSAVPAVPATPLSRVSDNTRGRKLCVPPSRMV